MMPRGAEVVFPGDVLAPSNAPDSSEAGLLARDRALAAPAGSCTRNNAAARIVEPWNLTMPAATQTDTMGAARPHQPIQQGAKGHLHGTAVDQGWLDA